MCLLVSAPLLLLVASVCAQNVDDALFRLALKSFEPRGEASSVISPFSLGMAMASANLGANGATSQEITDALFLGVEKEDVEKAFAESITQLIGITDYERSERERNADRYVEASDLENGLKLVEGFESDLKQHFATEVERLDFSGAPQQQAARINDFVKNTTLGMIERIIDDASINEGTRLVLVNALYLHLRFDKQFSSKGLEKERFVMESSEIKEVPMMFGLIRYTCGISGHSFETSDLLYVDFPMRKSDFRFFAVLPKNQTLHELKQQLASPAFTLSSVIRQRQEECTVLVTMPKFKTESDHSNITKTLRGLGVKKAFGDGADFSGITEEELFINTVVHKATFEVDEKGITAAASTVLRSVGSCLTSCEREPMEVRLDRPFLYGVTFKNTPLFVGQFYGENLPAFSGI
uniref:SERPIN domain-containing protein n=1 Tax=Steinernema glaseri TaxID=37863 RepID=A0A1I7ZMF9_9BILA